ncbi:hypothetical protein DACRYDRAFT_103475 [Dacryopinax primogenitus]|uniref:Uncharacterized protein n=1 Tax=Dacryopinax primogenitus (strain DJM 731) TaxID=1858805 RepID=M5GD01_DACPD|nr:uncharacterized protein DACRYDRAFT_103475 [Dacryopinax primogenitus]EJU06530.1 hypothetical protein DACRYDRAFT_103475 [Dacryopinax primogenitus]
MSLDQAMSWCPDRREAGRSKFQLPIYKNKNKHGLPGAKQKEWAQCKLKHNLNCLQHAKAAKLLDITEQAWIQTLDEISIDTGISKNILNANIKGRKAGYFDNKCGMSLHNAAKHLLAEEAWARGDIFYWALPKNQHIINSKVEWLCGHPEAALSIEQLILAKQGNKHLQVRIPAHAHLANTVLIQDTFEKEARGHACGFVVQGNIKDHAKLHFFGDELCKQFFKEIIGYPILQIAMGLEAYCTSRGTQGKYI